jgi:hypothetical protein
MAYTEMSIETVVASIRVSDSYRTQDASFVYLYTAQAKIVGYEVTVAVCDGSDGGCVVVKKNHVRQG